MLVLFAPLSLALFVGNELFGGNELFAGTEAVRALDATGDSLPVLRAFFGFAGGDSAAVLAVRGTHLRGGAVISGDGGSGGRLAGFETSVVICWGSFFEGSELNSFQKKIKW